MKQIIDSMLNEPREHRLPSESSNAFPTTNCPGNLIPNPCRSVNSPGSIPGNLTKLVQLGEFDASRANFQPAVSSNLKEIHSTLNESVQTAGCI